jgi:hypothetical protein
VAIEPGPLAHCVDVPVEVLSNRLEQPLWMILVSGDDRFVAGLAPYGRPLQISVDGKPIDAVQPKPAPIDSAQRLAYFVTPVPPTGELSVTAP